MDAISFGPQTLALAQRVAAAQGVSPEAAVANALEQQTRLEDAAIAARPARRASGSELWLVGLELADGLIDLMAELLGIL